MEYYRYLGQCDKLRQNNEKVFQIMMSNKIQISKEEFVYNTKLEELLEEETLEEFIMADKDSKFYKSNWGSSTKCKFIQTHGFEFIFIKSKL